MPTPTKGVPGCVLIGLAAGGPAAIGIAGVYGLYTWLHLPEESRHFSSPFWLAVGAVFLGPLLSWILLRLAVKIWKGTDFRGYDPTHEKDRGIK